jgi:spore coat polysaccharide biosynthesis protein SpsF
LPGKVLKPIAGKVLLDHVIGRLAGLNYPVEIVIATTDLPQDDVIALHGSGIGINVFRGSETDVLDRYYQCARRNHFDHVVRLTADNPFTDIEELERLIELHLLAQNDYTHSFGSMPLGVGAEIFTFHAIERSWHQSLSPSHREHVNEYIQENSTLFKIGVLEVSVSKSNPTLRLTVDNAEDYRRACTIVEYEPNRWIETEEAIKLCLQSV